jgi:hypothetical protein
MARAVVQHHQATHEDFTIVSFNPLPANILHFPAVHEVVHGFLEGHMFQSEIYNPLTWGRPWCDLFMSMIETPW